MLKNTAYKLNKLDNIIVLGNTSPILSKAYKNKTQKDERPDRCYDTCLKH